MKKPWRAEILLVTMLIVAITSLGWVVAARLNTKVCNAQNETRRVQRELALLANNGLRAVDSGPLDAATIRVIERRKHLRRALQPIDCGT